MEKIHINLGVNSYDIKFSDSFKELVPAMEEIKCPKKVLIVTDTNVEKLYADEVYKLLYGVGYKVKVFAFKAGEENKGFDSVMEICRACFEHDMDRTSMIVALGGGVVGDMAGFAAAIYMRGIRFIQVPTTLLSQSDSSVGGKTGIDFCGGKNIIGAFYQPKLVYINVSTLSTLPEREFVSGMGEVIKHGIIRDADFFNFLDDNVELVKSLNPITLIKMDKRNCVIKADVVEEDEKENGLRAILNFGHTISHAVESAYNFKMTHGECVGLGMIGASYISYKRGLITKRELSRIEGILKKYGFKTRVKLPAPDDVYALMKKDKKSVEGVLKFVLPVTIGEVIITKDVTKAEIYDALEYIND